MSTHQVKLHSSLPAGLEARNWAQKLQSDLVEQFELMLLCKREKREKWVRRCAHVIVNSATAGLS